MPRSKTPLERLADALIGLSIAGVIVIGFPALAVFVWLSAGIPALAKDFLIFGIVLGMLALTGLFMLFGQTLLNDRRKERDDAEEY